MEELKQCTKCKELKPASTEYFSKDSYRHDGYAAWCKICRSLSGHNYRNKNKEKIRLKHKQYYWKHLQQEKERKIKYYIAHKDIIQQRSRAYKVLNKAKVKLTNATYYTRNRIKIRNYNSTWEKTHRNIMRELKRKRRTSKQHLPCNFTVTDEVYALEYWDYKCTICKKPLDINANKSWAMDHWIPISDPRPDNPGTVPENMLPMCINCNSKKRNKNPIDWVKSTHTDLEANQILHDIDTYFLTIPLENNNV